MSLKVFRAIPKAGIISQGRACKALNSQAQAHCDTGEPRAVQ